MLVLYLRSGCCSRFFHCSSFLRVRLELGWDSGNWCWCVGCNPPFVFCGIRLIGLPAPSGRFFIGVCLPFPLAGRPFHRFQPSILNIRMHHRHMLGWTFRFCSVAKALALRPCRRCNSTRGRSFLKSLIGTRKPHTNSPAQKIKRKQTAIRILEALYHLPIHLEA